MNVKIRKFEEKDCQSVINIATNCLFDIFKVKPLNVKLEEKLFEKLFDFAKEFGYKK